MKKTLALTLAVALVSFTALAASRQTEVHAVWYAIRDGQPAGGTSPVVVRVADNQSGRPSVGVVEEYLGGAGDQWRAAAWLAAFNASRALRRGFHEHEFVVSSVGHIDGPSAGMLMTATMMALLNGVEVRPDVTMTGTVNPDGSAGPVGGIPQKMEGAKRQGMKRFGFPIGARMSVDMRTGKPVDLVKLGQRLGIEAVEVKDQWQAYELITGKSLPPPARLDEAAMGLSSAQRKLLEQRLREWSAYLQKGTEKVKAVSKELPAMLVAPSMPLLEEASTTLPRGAEHQRAGNLVGAHEALMLASVALRMADTSLHFAKEALAQDGDALVQRVAKEQKAALADLNRLYTEAVARRPDQTVDGVVNAVAALSDAVRAEAFMAIAREKLEEAQRSLAQGKADAGSLGPALMMLAGARGKVAIARERLALFPVVKGSPATNHASLMRHARTYGSAGYAALRYFETIQIEEQAKAQGVAVSQVRAAGAAEFMEYRIALEAARVALAADGVTRSPVIARVLELAAGAEAYIEAAGLVNKFYSLNGRPAKDGRWRVGAQDALAHQLRLARERALGAAAEAKRRVGTVPAASRWYFALGDANRSGDDDDRLLALDHYWTATVLADLATSLTGG